MRAAFGRIGWMVRKELRQVFRDPRMARLVIVAPIVQLLVFGYAVSTDVRHTPTIVLDRDQSRDSRELVSALTAGGYFDVVERAQRDADLADALDHGRAALALAIPAGYARDLAGGQATVQLLFDGTNSNQATISKGNAERIVQEVALARAAGGRTPALEVRSRAWYNPDLASRNYNVPAVIGLLLSLVCQLLTALAVVREREIGTLEQLAVSPLRPIELILGKTIPFALIALVDLVLITGMALLWFRVPFRGSPLLLLGATLLFVACALGNGLLISTISKTQQEAFLSAFLAYMPMVLLSGFMFPVASMPQIFQWITLANPMRHFLVIVRGVFLKGVTPLDVAPELGALALFALVVLGLATRRFHRAE
ncbi:MAG: drug efflux transport system permease protein [Acidobacteriota bacterium]|nr:drug efflux transport system permease protein [Acidobacteriota bacterium]